MSERSGSLAAFRPPKGPHLLITGQCDPPRRFRGPSSATMSTDLGSALVCPS